MFSWEVCQKDFTWLQQIINNRAAHTPLKFKVGRLTTHASQMASCAKHRASCGDYDKNALHYKRRQA